MCRRSSSSGRLETMSVESMTQRRCRERTILSAASIADLTRFSSVTAALSAAAASASLCARVEQGEGQDELLVVQERTQQHDQRRIQSPSGAGVRDEQGRREPSIVQCACVSSGADERSGGGAEESASRTRSQRIRPIARLLAPGNHQRQGSTTAAAELRFRRTRQSQRAGRLVAVSRSAGQHPGRWRRVCAS